MMLYFFWFDYISSDETLYTNVALVASSTLPTMLSADPPTAPSYVKLRGNATMVYRDVADMLTTKEIVSVNAIEKMQNPENGQQEFLRRPIGVCPPLMPCCPLRASHPRPSRTWCLRATLWLLRIASRCMSSRDVRWCIRRRRMWGSRAPRRTSLRTGE